MSWITKAGDFIRRIRPSGSGVPGSETQVVTAEYQMADTDEPPQASGKVHTLGTFSGVFTPSFLTIIGVIMYLRFSWVLSNAGLIQTVIIVVLANLITLITALSVASIASNEHMETGGAYFMVSRVMGYQAGGGIGIPLYISQALSIALYIIGFAESLNALLPELPIRLISFVTLGVLAIIAIIGSGVMVKIQFIILGIILVSFVSIALGFKPGTPVLLPDYQEGESFWTVFAVFFPAVTGILSGVSMSGDLKDPAKSIPRGTLAAVGAGFVVYLLVPIMLAFTLDRSSLLSSSALTTAARWPALVSLGIFGATLSSAIGSLLAAPRTMQALGIDGILPKVIGSGVGKRKEPLIALIISLALAFVVLLAGSLNLIAEILTMFFLTTYGVLNLSAAMERLVDNPSYRPALKVPWYINFLGAVGCVTVMFLISPLSTVIAITLVSLIFLLLRRKTDGPLPHSGIWEGFWTGVFFTVLKKLEKSRTNSGKNWRPLIQVFASEIQSHAELLNMARLITQRGGSLAVYGLVDALLKGANLRVTQELSEFVQTQGQSNTYVNVVQTKNFYEGVFVASQAAGFGAGLHNTVMLGMPNNPKHDRDYVQLLMGLVGINRNILLFRKGKASWGLHKGPILVWWGGQENNVRLMLILAYLVQQNITEKRDICVSTIVGTEDQSEAAKLRLETTLRDLRVTGKTRIIVNQQGIPIPSLLQSESSDASLVLLGMATPTDDPGRGYLQQLRTISDGLGAAVLFVLSNINNQEYI